MSKYPTATLVTPTPAPAFSFKRDDLVSLPYAEIRRVTGNAIVGSPAKGAFAGKAVELNPGFGWTIVESEGKVLLVGKRAA